MTHEARDALLHWWNAAVFGVCAYYFEAGLMWSAIIAGSVFVCTQTDYGHSRSVVLTAGSILLFFTLAYGTGLIPGLQMSAKAIHDRLESNATIRPN